MEMLKFTPMITQEQVLLDSNYKRKFKCEVMAIPRNLVEKLALAIRHEYFYINGKQFVWVGGSWNQERIEQTMLYNVDFEGLRA